MTILPFVELQWQNAHPDKVAAMNAFKTLCDDGTDTKQRRAFCSPISRRTGTIFLACNNDERCSFALVHHCCIEDRNRFFEGRMKCNTAFNPRKQQVLQANISECPAHHNLMIASACAVLVKIVFLHTECHEEFARGTFFVERTGRRNMISRNGIAKQGKHMRAVNILQGLRFAWKIFKIGRSFDIR